LIGYSIALLSGTQLLPLTVGFLVIAAFLLLSYWHKLSCAEAPGITSEMSGLTTFLVGALVCYGHFWIATTLSVASLLLLDLKAALEKLAVRVPPQEILTFAKFLFLTGVILPALPNEVFGRFHINPFKTCLVVVAVSTISYGSYVLQRLTKGQGGVVLAALLGGAYSSTVTTVVMARRAAREQHPDLFAGGRSVHHGYDPGGGYTHTCEIRSRRGSNRRRQQQPRERDLRLQPGRPEDRRAEPHAFGSSCRAGSCPLTLARTVNIISG
jgi:uncharacterized membrane protein (DUF4010 family)